MLDLDYSERLESLIDSIDWQIQLPPDWSRFFDETGECISIANDKRSAKRNKVRAVGVLLIDHKLETIPRSFKFHGIYTKDFSRKGCGFLADFQLFPEECVRILLPTFWIRLRVVRTRKVGPNCYESGGELLENNTPSPAAYEL